jgi:RNA polymerase sigma factor (sigma-70 family)
MAGTAFHTVLDHLRRLHSVAEAAQRSDRELLRAFVTDNDQDAFAVVVTRHAPLVWGVCRRILGHDQGAEDVFQATFLILARRAGSIRWKASVGGWLHKVARRLAMRARKRSEKRRAIEQQANRYPQERSSLSELAAIVDEELQRLPTKYREPLLLHYLQGATAEEAARQLGLSRTTFYNRLAYGRELLRTRLNRQGLSLAAPLLAASLTQQAQAAAPSLIESGRSTKDSRDRIEGHHAPPGLDGGGTGVGCLSEQGRNRPSRDRDRPQAALFGQGLASSHIPSMCRREKSLGRLGERNRHYPRLGHHQRRRTLDLQDGRFFSVSQPRPLPR